MATSTLSSCATRVAIFRSSNPGILRQWLPVRVPTPILASSFSITARLREISEIKANTGIPATPKRKTGGERRNSSSTSLPPRPARLTSNGTKSSNPQSQTAPPVAEDFSDFIELNVAQLLSKPDSVAATTFSHLVNQPSQLPQMALRPREGRSITMSRMDVARALKSLAKEVSDGNVRGDFRKQQTHERTGLRKKRLRRERWRRRFKAAFWTVLERVREMKRQGW